MGFFRIMAAIPGFFLSSLFFMLLWDVVAPKIGITADINYVTSMLITITLWLAVAPLAAVSGKKGFWS
jgi:positive regulator of sigma E activity